MEKVKLELLKIKRILENSKIAVPMIIKIDNNKQEFIVNEYFNQEDILKINLKYFFDEDNETKKYLINKYSDIKTEQELFDKLIMEISETYLKNESVLIYNLEQLPVNFTNTSNLETYISLIIVGLNKYRNILSEHKEKSLIIMLSPETEVFLKINNNLELSVAYNEFRQYCHCFDLEEINKKLIKK